jgi:hypothetical protein
VNTSPPITCSNTVGYLTACWSRPHAARTYRRLIASAIGFAVTSILQALHGGSTRCRYMQGRYTFRDNNHETDRPNHPIGYRRATVANLRAAAARSFRAAGSQRGQRIRARPHQPSGHPPRRREPFLSHRQRHRLTGSGRIPTHEE